MNTVGIDPGKTGRAAGVFGDLPPVFYPQPLNCGEWDAWLMTKLVEQWASSGVEHVVLESFTPAPAFFGHAKAGEGAEEGGGRAYSTHQQSMAYGMWRTAIAAHFPPHRVTIVAPVTWKTRMGILVPIIKAGRRATKAEKDIAYKARKRKAVEVAQSLWPTTQFVTPKGRLLDGEAEACLLAKYWDVIRPKQQELLHG